MGGTGGVDGRLEEADIEEKEEEQAGAEECLIGCQFAQHGSPVGACAYWDAYSQG